MISMQAVSYTLHANSFCVDAAKRRQLPAWIREGLEKMEKEKQKAMERERLEILRKQELEARKQAEDEARAVLNPSKSKFVSINLESYCRIDLADFTVIEIVSLPRVSQDSDSEKETEQDFDASGVCGQQSVEKNYDRTPDIVVRPRKSRFRDADSPESHTGPDESPTAAALSTVPTVQKRSREEILQDVVSGIIWNYRYRTVDEIKHFNREKFIRFTSSVTV